MNDGRFLNASVNDGVDLCEAVDVRSYGGNLRLTRTRTVERKSLCMMRDVSNGVKVHFRVGGLLLSSYGDRLR